MQRFSRRRNVLQLGTGPLPQGEGLPERGTHAKGNIGAQLRGETLIICLGQQRTGTAGCVQVAVRSNQRGGSISRAASHTACHGHSLRNMQVQCRGRFNTVFRKNQLGGTVHKIPLVHRHSGRIELPRLHLLIHQGAGHNIHAQAQTRCLTFRDRDGLR